MERERRLVVIDLVGKYLLRINGPTNYGSRAFKIIIKKFYFDFIKGRHQIISHGHHHFSLRIFIQVQLVSNLLKMTPKKER